MRRIRALSFRLLRRQFGSGSIAEKSSPAVLSQKFERMHEKSVMEYYKALSTMHTVMDVINDTLSKQVLLKCEYFEWRQITSKLLPHSFYS